MKNLSSKFVFTLILLAGFLAITKAHAEEIPTANLFVRYQDQIIYNGQINLTSTTYRDSINNIDYDLNTSTVFSALVSADQQSEAFNISDAQYNQTYNSFYLACLNVSTSSPENACYSWNYIVNGTYPSIGMDGYYLTGGETVYVYFSTPWQITATSSSLPVGVTTTLETWRYQYDNLNEPWVADGNNLVEITNVTTTQTDANGKIDFTFSATGTYSAQIVSTDWSKWSNPITINVIEALVNTTTDINTSTEASTSTEQTSGGSSGSGDLPNNPPPSATPTISQSDINNSAQKILNFLKSKQSANGSINEDLGLSDWTAMALGANGIYANTIKMGTTSLYDYLYQIDVSSNTDPLNLCTGYGRHVLGLLASGVDKSDLKITTLKNKIDNECLSGEKIGQDGINDDVFVLLAELAIEEPINNQIIQTAVNAIQADQQPNGAFTWNGWASQDITGAAVNALKYAQSRGATVDNSVFQKATAYLKSTQLADGGWGMATSSDALTTSWTMYGINALEQNQTDWTNNQKNPWSVLTGQLNDNGYYLSPYSADGIDWFATKHAVPALLGKSWPVILTPQFQPITGSDSSSLPPITTTTIPLITVTVTSTVEIATTTVTVTSTAATSSVIIITEPTTVIKQQPQQIIRVVQTPKLTIKSDPQPDTIPQTTTIITAQQIDQAPVDLVSKNIAKKILKISGGGAIGIILLIALGFLKNVI